METRVRMGKRFVTVFYKDGWYVVKGGTVVCRTAENISACEDLNRVMDYDVFTWDKSIETEEEFLKAIEK